MRFRLLLAAAALLLPLALRAQPMPAQAADRLFDESFRAALIQYLAERPRNEAAQETLRFIQSAPDVKFRCPSDQDSASLQLVSAAAVYYGRTKTILVSGNTLRKGGLEPDYARWRIEPSEYRRAIRLIAPILVHELKHAQIHRELGIDAPVKENELLAYAAQARYISQEPELATRENFEQGMKALTDYIPLLNERARLAARESGLSGDRLQSAQQRMAELDEELTRRGWTLSETDLDEYRIWAAFASGWPLFDGSFDYLGKASIFSDAELAAFVERMRGALKAGGGADAKGAATDENIRAAAASIETFGDPAKVRAARAYFRSRIDRVTSLSGLGFQAVPVKAQEPPKNAASWPPAVVLALSALSFCVGLWIAIGERRRPGTPSADPEMTAFVRAHVPRFGVEALRTHLLKEGHPRALVEASLEAARR